MSLRGGSRRRTPLLAFGRARFTVEGLLRGAQPAIHLGEEFSAADAGGGSVDHGAPLLLACLVSYPRPGLRGRLPRRGPPPGGASTLHFSSPPCVGLARPPLVAPAVHHPGPGPHYPGSLRASHSAPCNQCQKGCGAVIQPAGPGG